MALALFSHQVIENQPVEGLIIASVHQRLQRLPVQRAYQRDQAQEHAHAVLQMARCQFEGLRAQHSEGEEEPDPEVLCDLATHHIRQGHPDLAVAALQTAVRSPAFRFRAGAELGRLALARGDTRHGIAWFECAIEAPAPTLEDRLSVLYELGDALESVGEHVRALTVLLELDADSPGYRDVSARVARLKQTLEEPAG